MRWMMRPSVLLYYFNANLHSCYQNVTYQELKEENVQIVRHTDSLTLLAITGDTLNQEIHLT